CNLCALDAPSPRVTIADRASHREHHNNGGAMNDKPRTIILTGASGFVGRHLLDAWKNDYRIFAMARRSQYACNAPVHPNIAWLRADITDPHSLECAFREISSAGGAEYLVHLAAYYDFTGDPHPC